VFEKALKDNYDIGIKSIKLLADHKDTKVYLLVSDDRKYVLKTIPSRKNKEQLENEGILIQFLYENGIKVASLIKSNSGEFIVHDGESRFYMQEFIEGTVLMVNTAPDWYLRKSAQLLGQM
jgi:Ser/Thr protein kinase RdoA (MazF antagonist)